MFPHPSSRALVLNWLLRVKGASYWSFMVIRKASQLCQYGKDKMWSSCGFQAFHWGPELNVCVEIDSHRSYLFPTICSDHVYCLASSSTGKMRATGQHLWTDTHSCRTPTEPFSAQLVVRFHGFCQVECPQSGQLGWECVSRCSLSLGYLPCLWLE